MKKNLSVLSVLSVVQLFGFSHRGHGGAQRKEKVLMVTGDRKRRGCESRSIGKGSENKKG